MRRIRWQGLGWASPIAAVLAAVALAAPAGATAAAFHPGLTVKSGRFTVQVIGQEGGAVGVVVSPYAEPSASGPYSSTTYIARGTVSSHRLQAKFGSLGSISMRFQPSPNRTWAKPGRSCQGAGRFMVIKGTWVGSLRFRGEGDYLALNAKRAQGVVTRVAPKCEAQSGPPAAQTIRRTASPAEAARALALSSLRSAPTHGVEPSQESFFGEEVPYLEASWRHAVRGADFFVGADEEQSHFIFSAEESVGALAIFRYAQADASPHRFRVDRSLTHAHVRASKPFRGNAEFSAAADGSSTWSGPLTVAVPGEPRRRLTGEPFEPKLALVPELAFAFLRAPSAGSEPASVTIAPAP